MNKPQHIFERFTGYLPIQAEMFCCTAAPYKYIQRGKSQIRI